MNMSFTVDDIMKAKPSLRARALEARKVAEEAREAAKIEEEESLIEETTAFLRSALEVTDAELVDVHFDVGAHVGDRRRLQFTIDDLKFQSRYELKKVAAIQSDQFPGDTETIYEKKLVVEFKELPTSDRWSRVETLADLGLKIR